MGKHTTKSYITLLMTPLFWRLESGLAHSTHEAELKVLAGLSSHMEALGEKLTCKLVQVINSCRFEAPCTGWCLAGGCCQLAEAALRTLPWPLPPSSQQQCVRFFSDFQPP